MQSSKAEAGTGISINDNVQRQTHIHMTSSCERVESRGWTAGARRDGVCWVRARQEQGPAVLWTILWTLPDVPRPASPTPSFVRGAFCFRFISPFCIRSTVKARVRCIYFSSGTGHCRSASSTSFMVVLRAVWACAIGISARHSPAVLAVPSHSGHTHTHGHTQELCEPLPLICHHGHS